MTDAAVILVVLLTAGAAFLLAHYAGSRVVEQLTPPDRESDRRATEVHKRPYFWTVLIAWIKPFVPGKLGQDIRKRIVQAGGLEGTTPAEIMLYTMVSTTVALAVAILMVATTDWAPWKVLSPCIGATVLPFVWLRDQVKKRHLQILRDMPFHLDLLTLCVEAGLDFGAAVARMVDKGKPCPLREEFNAFLGEIRMGKTRAESLEAMSERVGLPALSSFIGSLIRADKLGSGLGKTLRLQSEQLRVERFQRAEKQAGEAPVKMLFPLVIFIFPTIWIILAGPLVYEWLFKGVM
ncbi:MAG: type II secretion system F family protein [Myxococcota bacterium]